MLPDPKLHHHLGNLSPRALPIIAALALAACSRSPEQAAGSQPAAAASGAPGPTGSSAAPPLPAPSAGSAHAPAPDYAIETLAGLWRVERVDAVNSPRGPALGPDDRRMLKAVLEVSREQMNWSYRPGQAQPENDICSGPHFTPVYDAALARRLAGALTRLGAGSATQAIAGIDCEDGGRWGPGAVGTAYISKLDADRMVMTWFDDSVLLLQRFQPPRSGMQAETDQPLHASDYSR